MWTVAAVQHAIPAASAVEHQAAPAIDSVMLFGFISVFFTMAFYINRHQSRLAMRGLAVCVAATAVYGFLDGAWPLGLMETAWSVLTFKRSFGIGNKVTPSIGTLLQSSDAVLPDYLQSESRISRMFGRL